MDPESYADGSIATGKVFHARQVKSEGTRQKVISWPSSRGDNLTPQKHTVSKPHEWPAGVIRMVEHRISKKALQQRIRSKSKVEKCKKRWKDGVREGAVTLLGIQTWKTKATDRESWRQHTNEAKDRF